jgi:FMNH2-dependent dimethyl sulfone monooxygenase
MSSLLIGVTEDIPIVTTMHHAWLHPLQIARFGADLQAMSGGRWGLNCVAGAGFAPDLLNSWAPQPGHDKQYAAASESMEIVLQAWRNDGEVDFEGEYFRAKGRLVGPSPGEGNLPLIVSAGSSPAGCEFAGRYASAVFIPGGAEPPQIADRCERIRSAANEAGRDDADDIVILLHGSVLVGETRAEAEVLTEELLDSVDVRSVVEMVSLVGSQTATMEEVYSRYKDEQLRELGTTGGARLWGDPEQVAEQIRDLRDRTGCDGVSLSFPIWQPEMIARFGEKVGPVLEEMGVWSPRSTARSRVPITQSRARSRTTRMSS